MSAQKRFILHIGTEKTGTTAAQNLLYSNRKALAAAGFALTDCFMKTNNRALAAYAAAPERDDPEGYVDAPHATPEQRAAYAQRLERAFAAEMGTLPSSIHTVILTSEHCHSRIADAAEAGRLRDLFAPYASEIRILVYLRRQIDMAVSSYSTSIKGGNADVEMLRVGGTRFRYFDHYALVERWAEAFGRENVDARIYASHDGRDQLDEFKQAVGIDALDLTAPPPSRGNRELPRSAQSLISRLAEPYRALAESAFGPSFRVRFLRRVETAARNIGEPEGYRPTRGEARAFQELFEEGNAKLLKQWFPQRETLFSDDLERYPERPRHARARHISPKEACEYAMALWRQEAAAAQVAEAHALALEATLALRSSRRKVAEDLLKRALAVDPQCPAALAQLAELRVSDGAVDEAEALYDRLVDRVAELLAEDVKPFYVGPSDADLRESVKAVAAKLERAGRRTIAEKLRELLGA